MPAKASVRGWAIERPHPRTVRVVTDVGRQSKEWEQWFLLRSDAHHDHMQCDRATEHRHLREAVERDAIILDCGDLFCAMQGRWDKRADPAQFRDEYRLNYLDSLVREAATLYGPYADRWLLMSPGNHETSIRKRHETDLTQRLVATLNDRHGTHIQYGTYNGAVQIRVRYNGTGTRGRAGTFSIGYHHGYGGGGPVTAGTIQRARQMASRSGIDVQWNGHIHESWYHHDIVDHLPSSGVPKRRSIFSIRSAGYKDEYQGGEGWHVETGKPPKPIGAWWLRLKHGDGNRLVPHFEEAR